MVDAHFWNTIAPRYVRKAVENPAAFERKIAITQRHLKLASRVLEIGCGTGSLALRLASCSFPVQGVDSAVEMIRHAERNSAEQSVDNVLFSALPLEVYARATPDASFHMICAFSVLHLAHDREVMLQSIFRLLRPGGILVTSTSCLAESLIPYRPLLRFMHRIGRAIYVAVFTNATLREEILRTGFVNLQEPPVGAKKIDRLRLSRQASVEMPSPFHLAMEII